MTIATNIDTRPVLFEELALVDPLAAAMTDQQRLRADVIKRTAQGPVRLAIFYSPDPANSDPGVERYQRQLCIQARLVGAVCVNVCAEDEEAIEEIAALNTQSSSLPSVDGAIYLTPPTNKSRIGDITRAFGANPNPSLNSDGMGGIGPHSPATPNSNLVRANLLLHGVDYYMRRSWEDLTRLKLPEGYSKEALYVVGARGAVGGGVVDALDSNGIKIQAGNRIDRGNEHVLSSLRERAVIFAATPQPGQLRSEHIGADSIIVDTGCGELDGVSCGNAHPELRLRSDVRLTPHTGPQSVGWTTAIDLMNNVLDTATARRDLGLRSVRSLPLARV